MIRVKQMRDRERAGDWADSVAGTGLTRGSDMLAGGGRALHQPLARLGGSVGLARYGPAMELLAWS